MSARPVIDLDALEASDQIAASVTVLVDANQDAPDPLYRYDGKLMPRDETGLLRPLTTDQLRLRLVKAADFGKGSMNGWKPMMPPVGLVRLVAVAAAQDERLPSWNPYEVEK